MNEELINHNPDKSSFKKVMRKYYKKLLKFFKSTAFPKCLILIGCVTHLGVMDTHISSISRMSYNHIGLYMFTTFLVATVLVFMTINANRKKIFSLISFTLVLGLLMFCFGLYINGTQYSLTNEVLKNASLKEFAGVVRRAIFLSYLSVILIMAGFILFAVQVVLNWKLDKKNAVKRNVKEK